jgi:hypothetical protein
MRKLGKLIIAYFTKKAYNICMEVADMTVKVQLLREIESLPADCFEEVIDFIAFIKQRRLKKIPKTMLLSEKALAKDWNTAEEDAAWANL